MEMWELVARGQIRDTLARHTGSAVVPQHRGPHPGLITEHDPRGDDGTGIDLGVRIRSLARTTPLPLEHFPPEAITFLHQQTMPSS